MALDKISKTGEYLYAMCDNIVLKCVGALGVILVEFHFGDLSPKLLSALFMLILFDFATGVWSADKSGEKIKSSKIFRTAWKLVLYFMVVSAGYFTELIIGTDLFIAKVIMVFLALTELISILENIDKGGYPMPSGLLRQLKILKKNK